MTEFPVIVADPPTAAVYGHTSVISLRALLAALWQGIQALVAILRTWRRRMQAREELRLYMVLDSGVRRDLGIYADAAEAEVNKPFWCA